MIAGIVSDKITLENNINGTDYKGIHAKMPYKEKTTACKGNMVNNL